MVHGRDKVIPKVMVLSGNGINCEEETAHAFKRVGARVEIVHVLSLLQNPESLMRQTALVLPGGFSFGDEIHSGQVMFLIFKYRLEDLFKRFVEQGGRVLGICNGFQILVRLGVFDLSVVNHQKTKHRIFTLAKNVSGKFIDRWVELEWSMDQNSLWLRGIQGEHLFLPVRHGEGRLTIDPQCWALGVEALRHQKALTYLEEVNGSFDRTAGLTDQTGQILGIMPHPEAALDPWLWPHDCHLKKQKEILYTFFENGIKK